MGSFNCAEFRSWHSTCSFTELQISGMEKRWKDRRIYSTFLYQGTINYVQNVPGSYQLELSIKVSYMGNSTSSQTNCSRPLILTIEKYFLPIFYFSYSNLSLLPFTHFTLNMKNNFFSSTLHLTLGISRRVSWQSLFLIPHAMELVTFSRQTVISLLFSIPHFS